MPTIHHQELEAINDFSPLVAVNPHKFMASNADSVLHKYRRAPQHIQTLK